MAAALAVWIGTERGELLDPAPVIATASDYATVPAGLTDRLRAERGDARDDPVGDARANAPGAGVAPALAAPESAASDAVAPDPPGRKTSTDDLRSGHVRGT